MHDNDFKPLITYVCDSLYQDKKPSQEQVIKYLKDAAAALEKINIKQFDAQTDEKKLHNITYKDIATSSLHSYKSSNDTFLELTNMHAETLNEYDDKANISPFTKKFAKIQSDMNQECQKANQLISKLMQQVKTLEQTSNLDPLTKVSNRRALISYLNKICANEHILSELHVLMLDIDDFKLVNDTHGHVAGDKILIYIANVLKKILRDGDKVFRYGGEEFVIILNRIDKKNCTKTTNRILEMIRANDLIYMGKNINVTASIGTTTHLKDDTPDLLIARADKALYIAKENGKNQMYTEI